MHQFKQGRNHEPNEFINGRTFSNWYKEQKRTENIQAGKTYFNGPPNRPDTNRHKPSLLIRCHRYAFYKRRNAPKESASPDGLFWFGSEFEEQVILPFLQDVSPDHLFVQNSVWTDSEIDVGDIELIVKGMTDPVLVTEQGDPVLVTEIKTSSSIENRTEPAEHHKAQLHAYLNGLRDQFDRDIPGVIVYISRDTLDLKAFSVNFDSGFWKDEVVEWMRTQTTFEEANELPPASPQHDWECKFCDYRARCGKTNDPFQDLGTKGFLTLFEYPEESVWEHVEAHDDVQLTPTLASLHPDVAAENEVNQWSCPSCSTKYHWDELDWDGDVDDPPVCPVCLENGELVKVRGEFRH